MPKRRLALPKGWVKKRKADLEALFHTSREQRFLSTMRATDDLLVVVVGQTYLEYHLRQMIRGRINDPNHFDVLRLNFEQLLELAISFGNLPDEIRNTLRALAALRNKFAHNIDYKLTAAHVDSLYSTLPRRMQHSWDALTYNRIPFISPQGWKLRLVYIFMKAAISSEYVPLNANKLLREFAAEVGIRVAEIPSDMRDEIVTTPRQMWAAGYSAGAVQAMLEPFTKKVARSKGTKQP